jgi:hypothetical protein
MDFALTVVDADDGAIFLKIPEYILNSIMIKM